MLRSSILRLPRSGTACSRTRRQSNRMPEVATRFKQFLSLVWRLAVYFAVLVGALKLLSMAYGRTMHSLGVHFVQSPNVKPAEAVGFGQARLLLAAILAWLITARLGRDKLGPILPLSAPRRRPPAARRVVGSRPE